MYLPLSLIFSLDQLLVRESVFDCKSVLSKDGRALHRYRRGHGFKSRTGLNFIQAFFLLLLKQCSQLQRSLSYSRLYPQFKYMTFIYSQPFIHHFTGLFGTNTVTTPSWLVSSVGRALVFIAAKIAFIFKYEVVLPWGIPISAYRIVLSITYNNFFLKEHGNESCNLIGSQCGPYFPISAHGQL